MPNFSIEKAKNPFIFAVAAGIIGFSLLLIFLVVMPIFAIITVCSVLAISLVYLCMVCVEFSFWAVKYIAKLADRK